MAASPLRHAGNLNECDINLKRSNDLYRNKLSKLSKLEQKTRGGDGETNGLGRRAASPATTATTAIYRSRIATVNFGSFLENWVLVIDRKIYLIQNLKNFILS